jgi:succinoglycan biosynthesis transport protein ExoP
MGSRVLSPDNITNQTTLPTKRRSVFGRLKRFARRQIKTINACVLMFGLSAIVIISHVPPLYTATALVRVDPDARHMSETSDRVDVSALAASLIESEVEILRSDTVARRAIRDSFVAPEGFSLQPSLVARLASPFVTTANSASHEQDAERRLVVDLTSRTRVERRPETFVVSVSVSDPAPQRAALLANALAEAYLAEKEDAQAAATQRVESMLAARVADLAVNLRSVEGRIDDMLLASAAASLARQPGVTAAQNSAIAAILEQLATERRTLFARRAALTRALRAHQAVSEPQTAQPMRVPLTADNDPSTLQSQRADIDERLTWLESATMDARDHLRDFMDIEDLSPGLSLTLFELQEEAETTRQVYHEALERLKQAQFLGQDADPGARLLSRAQPPLESRQPAKITFVVAGLAVGLGVGAGIGFLRERLFHGVFDAATIERAAQLPIVAVLPAVSRFDASAPQDLMVTAPLSPYAEAVRWLSLALQSQRRVGQALCVLMTSPNANEGKSTLALSYAMQAALSGKSTLLIDADLRQSALFDRLQWQMEPTGMQFSDVLSGKGDLDDIARLTFRDPQTGLKVLGNAQPPLGPPDTILASPQFADLVTAARSDHDVVVIDSAPILAFVDARILLSYADVAVMAMRHGGTTLPQIQRALRALDHHRGPQILGALTFADQSERGS